MPGTREGGLRARDTNYKKYGRDFYSRLGKKGGKNGHTGGFANNPALARIAGRKGGQRSRRGPGCHKSSTTLKSLLTQASKNRLIALKIRFADGGVAVFSIGTIRKLAQVYGQNISFEKAWAETTTDLGIKSRRWC